MTRFVYAVLLAVFLTHSFAQAQTATGPVGEVPVPTPPPNATNAIPKQFPLDNRALVTSLAFGQKPNGHVAIVMLDDQGRVFCALPESAPWVTLSQTQKVALGVLLAMALTWGVTRWMAQRERQAQGLS